VFFICECFAANLCDSVGGITDGGFGTFNTNFDEVALLANGTINWQATYMFGKASFFAVWSMWRIDK